jgi:hypothetical protein
MEVKMSKLGIIISSWVILSIAASAFAGNKIINCPNLNVNNFGKNSYYDARTRQVWSLNWLSKQKPTWNTVSIPQTTTCSAKKTSNGIPVTYQCAIFQCRSDAVIASLGRNHSLKCFSAYVSTQNTFYCDGFSTG